jgi:predicted O-linked N-acetylglucosamine transferase (SPINDLY family)
MIAAPAISPEAEPSALALVRQASRYVAAGDIRAALAALAEAAVLDPNYLPLHFSTALIAWRSGDFASALKVTRACFEREPMNGTLAEVLASLFAQTGDLRESLFHGKLATALKADQLLQDLLPADFPPFDRAFLAIQDRPLFAHAKLCRASGQIGLALDRARQHVEVAPEDAEALQFYAELLLRFGMAGTAVAALRPAVGREGVPPALISLYAHGLTEVADFDAARRWHDKACSAAPHDAAIAAARLADALWLGDDATAVAAAAADWVDRFAKRGKPAPRRAPREKLVIGYVVSEFFDRRDAAAVAAVAHAHDRSSVQVVGYGGGAKAWDENIVLGGAFEQWRDISRLDPATLARTFASDGLDAVIDVGGATAPASLQALAQARSALRVAWLQNPAGLEAVYDAVITSDARSGVLPGRCWPVGWGAYPLVPEPRTGLGRTRDDALRFGADILLRQLNREAIELWSALLNAIPRSVLLLRQNDLTSPENVNRLVERFGRSLAGRIDILSAASSGEFYRHVDIALAPTIGTSPRVVAEALYFGVPTLVLRHDRLGGSYTAWLTELGLGAHLVAISPEDYLEKGKSLAFSPEIRSRVASAIATAAASAEASAATIARAIEQAVRRSLTEDPQ